MRSARDTGFTLLEMMVAISVLAVALLAITGAQQSSINNAFRVQRGQAAALLMRGLVLNIEEEYRIEGFPENSITDRDCEVPDEFEDLFECVYDLERMDLDATQIQQIVDQSFGGLLGEGGLNNLGGGDRSGMSSTVEGLLSGGGEESGTHARGSGGLDLSGLSFLLPFLGPEGEALMSLCNINLSMLVMGFMGVQAFVPQVLQEVGNRTRKLTVRLTWNEGPFGTREFKVSTFIASLPEEQIEQLKQVEDAQELLDGAAGGLQGVPGGDRGGAGGGAGGGGGGGEGGGGDRGGGGGGGR
jgi:prepilin-type N-terminal cleavage/methylation domain-containing protein